MNIVDLVAH